MHSGSWPPLDVKEPIGYRVVQLPTVGGEELAHDLIVRTDISRRLSSQWVAGQFHPVREHKVTIKGEAHAMYDLMGKDAVLFHHAANDDDTSTGTQYVGQAKAWFDSMWQTVGRETEL